MRQSRSFLVLDLHFSLLIFSLFFVGCASTPPAASLKEAAVKRFPAWVEKPQEECPAGHLCVVGEGKRRSEAEQDARRQLAMTFETHVKSSLKAYEESHTAKSKEGEIVDGSKEESQTGHLALSSEIMVRGSRVEEQVEVDGRHYVFLVFNKRQEIQRLEDEMQMMDGELKRYLQFPPRAFRLVQDLRTKRADLNARYTFLKGTSYAEAVSAQELESIRGAIQKLYYRIEFETTTSARNQLMVESVVTKTLSDYSCYQDQKKASRLLSVQFMKEELPMNVGAFKQHEFRLTLYWKTLDGEVLQTESFQQTYKNRYEHLSDAAFQKDLVPFLEEHIAKWN